MYNKMKPGYQGKKDAMRELAERLMSESSNGKGTVRQEGPSKEKTTPYEGGGAVKKMHGGSVKKKPSKSNKMQKYAMGGVAKIRHEEATKQGLPKSFKKKPIKDM